MGRDDATPRRVARSLVAALRIIVVTPSLPERDAFRAEAIASVKAQTLRPVDHLVMIDEERRGPAATLNAMLPHIVESGADWVAQLADDDVMYPNHLRVLADASEDADVVYTFCDVEGRGGWNPNTHFDADLLRVMNYIPATTLIRTSLCVELDGWRENSAYGFEDWDFWLRALDTGARFVCVPIRTWCYRFHGSNLSGG
jgi:glycosyltransferase involved in cell wall biosynthesis